MATKQIERAALVAPSQLPMLCRVNADDSVVYGMCHDIAYDVYDQLIATVSHIGKTQRAEVHIHCTVNMDKNGVKRYSVDGLEPVDAKSIPPTELAILKAPRRAPVPLCTSKRAAHLTCRTTSAGTR